MAYLVNNIIYVAENYRISKKQKQKIRKDMFAIKKLYKRSNLVPEDTGALKNIMTHFISKDYGFDIVVSENPGIKRTNADSKSYGYFLHTGTSGHDIPNSFGRGMGYGFGRDFGRDFFHPGSNKWKGWFTTAIPAIIENYFGSSIQNLDEQESKEYSSNQKVLPTGKKNKLVENLVENVINTIEEEI